MKPKSPSGDAGLPQPDLLSCGRGARSRVLLCVSRSRSWGIRASFWCLLHTWELCSLPQAEGAFNGCFSWLCFPWLSPA